MKINYYICQQLTLKFIFIKKISIFAASLLFVAAAVTGYKAWQNSHLTPEEALMKANIEALASDETGEGHDCSVLGGECYVDLPQGAVLVIIGASKPD